MRAVIILGLVIGLSACGPQETAKPKEAAGRKASVGRKCPDPNIRDATDPCSSSYLPPYKPRFKRDKF